MICTFNIYLRSILVYDLSRLRPQFEKKTNKQIGRLKIINRVVSTLVIIYILINNNVVLFKESETIVYTFQKPFYLVNVIFFYEINNNLGSILSVIWACRN